MSTPLIVTADDYGLTDATARAILTAHLDGVVTATSVLALAPGALERLAWLDDAGDLAVGVHLALVGEDPPLLSAREIPSLVDRRGALAESWRRLVPRLAARRVDPADIRRELEAQVDAVAERHAVDHLDSHQHLHLWPSIAAVVVDVAVARGIGRVRVPRSSGAGLRGIGIGRLADRLAARLTVAGIGHTDGFLGVDEAGGWTADRLAAAIGGIDASVGAVEINTHPGAASDPDRARYAWEYGWGDELQALTAPATRRAIDQAGLVLCGTLADPPP